ncbi:MULTISPECIES: beta-propeller fold lactonase family protein [Tatumella]|uniref:Lactonase family protein n=1 Tax=Tatumella punctata TaxID=399969 RepID=A0ABW1VNS5_9GAMM|nr:MULTISPECIES: beta-propeller fold lactonase family protein [unclassified Tatumella]MBS0857510.1 beta-propeller fold lactonase family protein [Tatumella sp. JGM16]MBS0876553.1 beta-propeller fold lactonase family protein [Tatumella sp. JGM82]MBS0890060.1 beta-propeller fold lactonase family protein [Tatumella sp. JGM94]MBS0895051.1 beta-propeller fold lactonase family protein [Tatumella sp. JGM130]MBS0901304.1 beta-propeller fold lactonase family protein [Tatumella sp. JGM100]
MKKILFTAALVGLCSVAASAAATPQTFVYISNAASGTISAWALDKHSQTMQPVATYPAAKQVMSSVVSPDKKTLYAAIRSKPYRVMSWHIADNGTLTPAGETPLQDSMAYISLDRSGHYLLSASYGGDLFTVNRINDKGQPEAPPVQIVHTGKRAHCIQTDPTNQFLYVSLLGADQFLQYRFDPYSGKVTPATPPAVNIQHEAATGPRHFIFAPRPADDGNHYIYLLTEMAGNIQKLKLNRDGTVTPQEATPSIAPEIAATMQKGEARPLTGDFDLPDTPKPRIWQADIHMTPDGKFLYSTERTNSLLTAFSVSPRDGSLHLIRSIHTEKLPRGFAIDNSGRFLIETGLQSDHFSLYHIDQHSGELTLLSRYPSAEGANWVTVVEG